jgi:hypothetical protein
MFTLMLPNQLFIKNPPETLGFLSSVRLEDCCFFEPARVLAGLYRPQIRELKGFCPTEFVTAPLRLFFIEGSGACLHEMIV